LFGESEAM